VKKIRQISTENKTKNNGFLHIFWENNPSKEVIQVFENGSGINAATCGMLGLNFLSENLGPGREKLLPIISSVFCEMTWCNMELLPTSK
jgi:hypothetical protein